MEIDLNFIDDKCDNETENDKKGKYKFYNIIK